ncbi:4'-phosphopantetheinyl transferase superfamily protein [Streptomyces sp. CNQ085]|uniref:4'-phosphopantetheinyl transferase family protein n=1 Tax=Streptomyces sp. CNQ085 TaxID=2886944 RepID=UPI001F506325|nr:4'-phosphopantetheinyl transferase superfamily protein [Streptomyces sp. CNQ085]MCI0383415.1 4'-phosphopantetheinyl transferase superfamily protein [Streptomyces sp. CNQ085]
MARSTRSAGSGGRGGGTPGLLEVAGPLGPWDGVRGELAHGGTAVVAGRLPDWRPPVGDAVLRRMLGRDWHRYEAMSQPLMKERFSASRLLLRHVVAAAIDTAPEQVDLAYQPGGRPYVRGCDQIDISLSHTRQTLVAGITRRGRIGVDVESADRRMAGTGSESQGCTPYELARLDEGEADDRNATLVRLWTLKEAYSKALGQGLRFRFTEFGFDLDAEGIRLVRPDGTPAGGGGWTFATGVLDGCPDDGPGGGYVVGTAVHDSGFGEASDLSVRTALDAGLLDALLGAAAPSAVSGTDW